VEIAGDGSGRGRGSVGSGEPGPDGPPGPRHRGHRRRGALAHGLRLHRALLHPLPRAPQVLLQARVLPRSLGGWPGSRCSRFEVAIFGAKLCDLPRFLFGTKMDLAIFVATRA
jgi:hypothetical protein